MCCHIWAKFTKNSCVLFLDSRYVVTVCILVSWFATTNWPQFVVQFIVAFLPNFGCPKAVERGSSRMIAHEHIKSSPKISPQSSPESRVQVLHRPQAGSWEKSRGFSNYHVMYAQVTWMSHSKYWGGSTMSSATVLWLNVSLECYASDKAWNLLMREYHRIE